MHRDEAAAPLELDLSAIASDRQGLARQRQDGAGPVDTKVIVMERPQKKPPSTKIESS